MESLSTNLNDSITLVCRGMFLDDLALSALCQHIDLFVVVSKGLLLQIKWSIHLKSATDYEDVFV